MSEENKKIVFVVDAADDGHFFATAFDKNLEGFPDKPEIHNTRTVEQLLQELRDAKDGGYYPSAVVVEDLQTAQKVQTEFPAASVFVYSNFATTVEESKKAGFDAFMHQQEGGLIMHLRQVLDIQAKITPAATSRDIHR